MFTHRMGFQKPVIKEINRNVEIGVHYPLGKGIDAIIEVNNKLSGQVIALNARTLLSIANYYILDVLSNTSKFFFNKEKERKFNKRKKQKKST